MQDTVRVARRAARPRGTPRPPRRLRALHAVPAVLAVAMLPGSYDGAHDVKLFCVAAIVAVSAWSLLDSVWWSGRRRLGPPGWAGVALLVAVLFATVASDRPVLSWFGPQDYHNGAVLYVVGLSLFVLFAAVVPIQDLGLALRTLAAGGAVAVGYWFLQLAGADPLGTWPPPGTYAIARPLVSTLDNPNFAGAFLAAALPAGVWATSRARPGPPRLLWGAVTALLAVGVVGAASLQAPVAAAAGLGMLALGVVARRAPRALPLALAVGALVVATAGAGLAQRGPLAVLGRQETAVSRTWDWTAAVRMARAEPLTGVGFMRYGRYHPAYRPPHDVRVYGWQTNTASAHDVPLDMAAGGGLPLLAAYLVFVALVGLRLLRGLRTLQGRPQELLSVFGAVWLAYQAQSLVSIDVPQLALLHYLSAGAILALTSTAREAVRDTAPGSTRTRRGLRRAGLVAVSVAVLAPLLLVVTAERFLGQSAATSDRETALAQVRRSARLAPWQPLYWSGIGVTEVWGGAATQEALDAHLQAVRRDPRALPFVVAAAEAADALDQLPLSMDLWRRALRLEPHAAEVKVKAASVALRLGRTAEAESLVERALAFAPDNQEARSLAQKIARARARGDRDG